MNKKNKHMVLLTRLVILALFLSIILVLNSCAAQKSSSISSTQAKPNQSTTVVDTRDDNTIRSSAKHYTNGQEIPGVGTAMGDVYILPDGGCFGGEGECGIRWTNGAQALFGKTITPRSPIVLFKPGSPATKK